MRATITAIAHCVPPEVVTNETFASLGVSDDWIRERTGISERRILRGGGTSDMVVPAARTCLERAKLSTKDIDCVLVRDAHPRSHHAADVVHDSAQARYPESVGIRYLRRVQRLRDGARDGRPFCRNRHCQACLALRRRNDDPRHELPGPEDCAALWRRGGRHGRRKLERRQRRDRSGAPNRRRR